MKYAIVINAFAPDAADQAQKLAGFLTDHKLNTENGTAIIHYNPELTDTTKLESISALLPVDRVFYVAAKEYLPEDFLPYLAKKLSDTDCILFPGNYFGEELCVRLGARLRGSSLNNVQELIFKENEAQARKKIYSGHLVGTFTLPEKPYVITIDKSYSASLPTQSESAKERIFESLDSSLQITEIAKQPLEKESFLEDVHCVIVGGRGLKNKQNTDRIARLAERISVPLAGSRPCVMNAWLPMNRLIGVSGTMISPELCILLGVSGAPALYSGIEKSKYIIAVNSDADAPIMKKADLAICGDAMELFETFVKKCEEKKNEN